MRKISVEESFVSFESRFDKFWVKSKNLYSEIDAWHDRINSFGSLNFEQKAISFPNTHQYLELLNFLWGEYDLLYHGEIKSVGKEVITKRVGYYNHDGLVAHFEDINDEIEALEREKKTSAQKDQLETIKEKREIIELQFNPSGQLLVEGALILKNLFSKFESILKKRKIGFNIIMKKTSANTPFVGSISDPDTKSSPVVLRRSQVINFDKQLVDHPWFPSKQVQPAPKKKKIEQVEKVGPIEISKTVQTTEKLAVKERRKRNVVESSPEPEESPPKPLESTSLEVPSQRIEVPSQRIEVPSQHLNFDREASDIVKTRSLKPQHSAHSPLEIVPFQTSHCSSVGVYPFSNRHELSIVKGDVANKREELKYMVQQYLVSEEENDRSNFENAVYSIKVFSELGWSFQEFLIGFE
jgi:hypothetical protein